MRNSTKIIMAVRSSFSRLQQLKNAKLLHHNNYSTMNKFIKPCLDSFKTTLEEINPSSCVQTALHLRGNQLTINERTYFLDKNVYLIAIGKAAIGMVQGAEKTLGQHLIAGIASIPDGARIPEKSSTLFLRGAKDNLPDERSLHNSKQIEEFINEIKMKAGENANKQIILFLISGGGSALFPAPIHGITLAEKLQIIQLLQRSSANIQQLNTVRTALSRLKGGGLARIAHPTKMISLIISDIVGDPIELISSGPTVIPNEPKDPTIVLKELRIADKVSKNILNALEKSKEQHFQQNINVQNLIVANNTKMLKALSQKFSALNFLSLIVTNKLEGNATIRGAEMAKLLINLMNEEKKIGKELAERLLIDEKTLLKLEECINQQSKPIILLFGGETTVKFDDQNKISKGAKGGRNQELVLAAFERLLSHKKEKGQFKKKFAIFSLGTDGQDGPTDATGAFISSDELSNQNEPMSNDDFNLLCSKVKEHLEGKNSYAFWSQFNAGRNFIKIGKTGMNVMDVQIILILP